MPNVGGKKFPYTAAGRRAASNYRKTINQGPRAQGGVPRGKGSSTADPNLVSYTISVSCDGMDADCGPDGTKQVPAPMAQGPIGPGQGLRPPRPMSRRGVRPPGGGPRPQRGAPHPGQGLRPPVPMGRRGVRPPGGGPQAPSGGRGVRPPGGGPRPQNRRRPSVRPRHRSTSRY